MKKKAIILDLDNTIYSAPSIGDLVYQDIYELIRLDEEQKDNFEAIKKDFNKKPFQWVAKKYAFSEALYNKVHALMSSCTVKEQISPFSDYKFIKELSCDKFLVTSGYTELQRSKIKNLGIKQDFEDIFIVDATISDDTKKSTFQQIMDVYKLQPSEILIIGDDAESEIKAGKELGIDCLLYDKNVERKQNEDVRVIQSFEEVNSLFAS